MGTFFYFLNGDDNKSLNFKIIQLNKGHPYRLSSKICKNRNDFSFETNITLNDLSKIDENRLYPQQVSGFYIFYFSIYIIIMNI